MRICVDLAGVDRVRNPARDSPPACLTISGQRALPEPDSEHPT